jgi:mRNA-degrading endonuclease RelE of RelBE toxin-antitoxin system
MTPSAALYEIRLLPGAIRQLRKLRDEEGRQIRAALRERAARSASPGSRGGKSLKTIHGRQDRFHRLRVGELRVVFDLIREERVLRVHGIVNRRDLDRWLRGN